MKKLTPQSLIENINNWRKLNTLDSVLPYSDSNKELAENLKNTRKSCEHTVFVHLSTFYNDDGLCDPDFYSFFKCLQCGSQDYTVPSGLCNPDAFCINISNYASDRNYSDEEKFLIVELRVRQLVSEHPNYSIEKIVQILNEEFAKI